MDIIIPDRLYHRHELPDLLTCGRAFAYTLVKKGEIASVRLGSGARCVRVQGRDVIAYIDSRREGGPQPERVFKYLKLKGRS